jgi:hypothetical protein
MNCEQLTDYIRELSIHTARNALSAEYNEHIEQCDNCYESYQQQKAYLTKMQTLQTPDLSPTAASVMLRNVRLQSTERKVHLPRANFMHGFIAASILALSVFGTWSTWHNDRSDQEVVALPNFVTTEVFLVINVPEDIYDADLKVVLPQQVSLVGYEDMAEITWPVDLKQGTNTLSLPIKVNTDQQLVRPFSIVAKIYHYTEEREFKIEVDLSKIQPQANKTLSKDTTPNNQALTNSTSQTV